jgi:RNA polymerase sigma factor (sigma-70 family)
MTIFSDFINMNMKAHDVFGPQGLWEAPEQGDFLLMEFGDDVICVETQIAEITWNGDLILEGDETLAEVLKTCGLTEVELANTQPFYQVDPGPEQALLRKERAEKLKAAIDTLPYQQRQMIILHLKGYTNAEVAQNLNVSQQTVYVQLAKIQSILRYHMSKAGLNPDRPRYRAGFKPAGEPDMLPEAEYHGRTVKLGKPFLTPDGPKKRSVYVKNPKSGNVIKVNFGDKKMKIKKSNPARRRSFRARHKCHTAKDRTKARYWSCKFW